MVQVRACIDLAALQYVVRNLDHLAGMLAAERTRVINELTQQL
jgi:hypothetical protein